MIFEQDVDFAAKLFNLLSSIREGIKDGFASFVLSFDICCILTAISDWRQSLQFANLNKEKGKIYIQVRAF